MNSAPLDHKAMHAVSPTALSAYARSLGWSKGEPFGASSDVYQHDGHAEIVLPRTQNIADYASVVWRLLSAFSDVTMLPALSVYRDLVTADRDVVRFRLLDSADDGAIPVEVGVTAIQAARDLILSAACSLRERRAAFRAGANREATDYLEQVRIGQTELGSYVVRVLSPVVPYPMQGSLFDDAEPSEQPLGRQMTHHLARTLDAARQATDQASSGDEDAFQQAVQAGVSANLCEALEKMSGTGSTVQASFSWACTRPLSNVVSSLRFVAADSPVLREAGQVLRAKEPSPDQSVFGFVKRLERDEHQSDGTISVTGLVEGRRRTVRATLSQSDYHRVIEAHRTKSAVVLRGDLERSSKIWRLVNPVLENVISNEEDSEMG